MQPLLVLSTVHGTLSRAIRLDSPCAEDSAAGSGAGVAAAGTAGIDGQGRPKERENTSLGWLTSRFIEFLERCPDGAADLTSVCEHLAVPKRRMYDITNVLEGVGLLDKRGKNTVVWRGMAGASDSTGRAALAAAYRKRLEELDEESLRLDAALAGESLGRAALAARATAAAPRSAVALSAAAPHCRCHCLPAHLPLLPIAIASVCPSHAPPQPFPTSSCA